MAKQDNPLDELADFDPEAPPENPPDELAIARTRRRRRLAIFFLLLAVLVVLIHRSTSREVNPGALSPAAYAFASPVVNLQGMEVVTLGPIEGPYFLIDVLGPRDVLLGGFDRGENRPFRLIGLSDSDYLSTDAVAALPEEQRAGRRDRLARINSLKVGAIRDFCGTNRHFILRFPPAAADQPEQIFLLQPIPETNTSRDPRQPNGQAYLVNAWLLRHGKANLDFNQLQQFFDPPMLDCQLAAILEAQSSAPSENNKTDSIWTLFPLKMPMSDAIRTRMDQLKPYVVSTAP